MNGREPYLLFTVILKVYFSGWVAKDILVVCLIIDKQLHVFTVHPVNRDIKHLVRIVSPSFCTSAFVRKPLAAPCYMYMHCIRAARIESMHHLTVSELSMVVRWCLNKTIIFEHKT